MRRALLFVFYVFIVLAGLIGTVMTLVECNAQQRGVMDPIR